MRLLRHVAFCLLTCVALTVTGQELVWDVDFNTVFANREGGDELRPDQTFLFTRLEPEIGVKFVDSKQNTHQLMGGVSWYQPLNDGLDGYKVMPTLYYHGTHQAWDFTLGAFPRQLMRHELPKYLWSDSLNYCMPQVRGAMVQYESPDKGWMQMFFDWRQMQSRTRREAFNVVLSGGLDFGRSPLYALAHIQYNHLAKRKDAPEGEGVNDDATVNPMLGCRFSIGRVSTEIEAGAIVQLQRRRKEHKWHTPCGFVGNINARWCWLEVKESVYAGKDLFPLYDRYGSEFNLGDPYYRSKFYSRTDVRGHLFNNDKVDVSAMLTFHATDQITGFWQQLSCRFFIGGAGKRFNKGEQPVKPIF